MEEVQISDQFYNKDKDNNTFIDTVIDKLHDDKNQSALFYQIHLQDQTIIEIAPFHLLFINRQYVYAQKAQIGDYLYNLNGISLIITDIKQLNRKGVYSPLTTSGTIIVNNLQVSVFSYFENQLFVHQWFTIYTHYISSFISLNSFM